MDSADSADPCLKLTDFLIQLYLTRALTAKDLCTTMWYAKEAGVEEASHYAKDPASDHFQKFLNARMGIQVSVDSLCTIEIPCTTEGESSGSVRGKHQLKVMLPHESLSVSLSESPDWKFRLEEKVEANDFPPGTWSTLFATLTNQTLCLFLYLLTGCHTRTTIIWWGSGW